MSYGWLTESALPPKPGKPIAVPSGSLSNLKSILYKSEEDGRRRRLELLGKEEGILRSKPKRRKTKAELLMAQSNPDVEIRSKRDEVVRAEVTKDYSSVKKKLEEKAKIYEAMMASAARGEDMSEDATSSSSRLKEFEKGPLVDFAQKVCEDPLGTDRMLKEQKERCQQQETASSASGCDPTHNERDHFEDGDNDSPSGCGGSPERVIPRSLNSGGERETECVTGGRGQLSEKTSAVLSASMGQKRVVEEESKKFLSQLSDHTDTVRSSKKAKRLEMLRELEALKKTHGAAAGRSS